MVNQAGVKILLEKQRNDENVVEIKEAKSVVLLIMSKIKMWILTFP